MSVSQTQASYRTSTALRQALQVTWNGEPEWKEEISNHGDENPGSMGRPWRKKSQGGGNLVNHLTEHNQPRPMKRSSRWKTESAPVNHPVPGESRTVTFLAAAGPTTMPELQPRILGH